MKGNTMSKPHKHKKGKVIKRIFIGISIFAGILLLVIGGYVYGVLGSAQRAAKTAFAPLKTTNTQKTTSNLKELKPFSILLLGVDTRDNNLAGRSDSMIVATINPNSQKTTLVSIPRDTFVPDVSINKINSAYADNGAQGAIDSVNKLLNIKIDHYMTINFEGLTQLVDAVGGINVNSDIDFTTSHTVKAQGNVDYHFNKEMNHLNGEKALAYSRERYNDPSGDYGRQNRQVQIVNAILAKSKSMQTLTNYNDLFNILGTNIKTDLSWNNLKVLFNEYRPAFNSFSNTGLKGEGKMINNLSYQVVPESETTRVHNIISAQLK